MPYIRLLLDNHTDTFLPELLYKLQNEVDDFYCQLDPQAYLGCHPYHITFIGGLGKYSDEQVQKAIEECVQKHKNSLQFNCSNWHLSYKGSLKLEVNSIGPEFKEFQEDLAKALGCSTKKIWHPARGTENGYHITCGTFLGTSQEREKLNNYLQEHLQLKGLINCSIIEFENDSSTRRNPDSIQLI